MSWLNCKKYLRLQFIHGINLNWEEYATKFKEKSRNRLCLFHKLLECKDCSFKIVIKFAFKSQLFQYSVKFTGKTILYIFTRLIFQQPLMVKLSSWFMLFEYNLIPTSVHSWPQNCRSPPTPTVKCLLHFRIPLHSNTGADSWATDNA